MKVLFVLPATTVYEKQNRVIGWRETPVGREELKTLRELVPRLRELGATAIIASDLDDKSAYLLSNRLKVPIETWTSMRRLNVGKLHGQAQSHFAKIYTEMEKRWESNPDIPLPSGDSLSSYKKRMSASLERLKKASGVCVVMAGAREIGAMTGLATDSLERGKVYEWQTN